jgi:hypothetical protein
VHSAHSTLRRGSSGRRRRQDWVEMRTRGREGQVR